MIDVKKSRIVADIIKAPAIRYEGPGGSNSESRKSKNSESERQVRGDDTGHPKSIEDESISS